MKAADLIIITNWNVKARQAREKKNRPAKNKPLPLTALMSD